MGWLRSGKIIILIRVSYHDWDGCVVGWLRSVKSRKTNILIRVSSHDWDGCVQCSGMVA